MLSENPGIKKEKYMRPNWDGYFINILEQVGTRGTCDRGRSGAIIVKDNRILTTGYVGAPQGLPHCDEVGHLMHKVIDENGEESEHCVRTIHAEENAILQGAQFGIPLIGSTIYATMCPCFRCAMKIIRVGIVEVVALYHYHKEEYSLELFKQAGIEIFFMNSGEMKYDK
jgi:dCMP deaminase